jgi:zinc transport system substrate-binding protein
MRLILTVISILVSANMALAQVKVVSTAYPLGWLASELGGNAVSVSYPIPGDEDAEFWRPSISSIAEIQQADVILLNGAGFAAWTDRVSLPRRALVLTTRGLENSFIATQAVTHSHGGDTHSHEGVASFTWMDPTLFARQGEAIATALRRRGVSVDESVLADLEALAERLTSLPSVTLATSHPRYQYLAARAGFETFDLEIEAGAAISDMDATKIAASGAKIVLLEAPAAMPDGLTGIVWPTYGRAEGSEDILADWNAAMSALEAALAAP